MVAINRYVCTAPHRTTQHHTAPHSTTQHRMGAGDDPRRGRGIGAEWRGCGRRGATPVGPRGCADPSCWNHRCAYLHTYILTYSHTHILTYSHTYILTYLVQVAEITESIHASSSRQAQAPVCFAMFGYASHLPNHHGKQHRMFDGTCTCIHHLQPSSHAVAHVR